MADPKDDGIGGRRPMDGSANYLAGNSPLYGKEQVWVVHLASE